MVCRTRFTAARRKQLRQTVLVTVDAPAASVATPDRMHLEVAHRPLGHDGAMRALELQAEAVVQHASSFHLCGVTAGFRNSAPRSAARVDCTALLPRAPPAWGSWRSSPAMPARSARARP